MPTFAANLTFLFTEVPFLDRFAAAAAAGFTAVEYLFPYDYPEQDLAARLAESGLKQALINMPAGNWAGGERGLTCLPDRTVEFRAGIDTAIRYAQALDCSRVHLVAGLMPADADSAPYDTAYLDNLRYAADRLAPHGITALIEPINQRDVPGFYLRDTTQALAAIEQAGRENLRLQFDIYHAQVTEGDLATRIANAIDKVGHFQIGNPPGRHEPDNGEINYPYLFDLIDRLGYDGWIGCEYTPAGATADGLGWGRAFGLKQP